MIQHPILTHPLHGFQHLDSQFFLAVSFVVVVFSASECSQHVVGDSLTPPVGLSLLFQMSH